jgi:hypothetical protein
MIPDPDDISGVGRMLLRDIARIRGTRPTALAAVENFILDWLTTHPDQHAWTARMVPPSDCGWAGYSDPPPTEFYDAYEKWQASLPAAQRLENQPPDELDDPIETQFWDLHVWLGLVWRLPPPHLHEAVLIDVFACQREIDSETRDAIWRWRYPDADDAQWDKWLNDIHAFLRSPGE